jgi:hypothetical protein
MNGTSMAIAASCPIIVIIYVIDIINIVNVIHIIDAIDMINAVNAINLINTVNVRMRSVSWIGSDGVSVINMNNTTA